MHYCYSGFSLRSNVELPELPLGAEDAEGQLTFTAGVEAVEVPGQWNQLWRGQGGSSILTRNHGSGVAMRFDDSIDFFVDCARWIVSTASPLSYDVRQLLFDQVLPRVLNQRGHLMLHASAVGTRRGTILVVGDSGVGKSTLAAYLHSTGLEMHTDDGVRLLVEPDGGVSAIPNYRSLRLHADAANAIFGDRNSLADETDDEKRQYVDHSGSVRPSAKTVSAIVVIEPDASTREFKTMRLGQREAMVAILSQLFVLDGATTSATIKNFLGTADIVRRVPVFALRYTRSFESLPRIAAALDSELWM